MQEKDRKSIWKTPQYCITIFVLISAFTTGQGMTENFFNGNIICGIGISIGIQLLLVWLGWKVPKLFVVGTGISRALLIFVYLFTIFWSTGFSYVYVCNQIYKTTKMRDGQEVLVDAYREDSIIIQDLAKSKFLDTLSSLKNGLDSLQEVAKSIDEIGDDEITKSSGDFEKLKECFSKNPQMLSVIQNVENIISGKSVGDIDKMASIVKKNKKRLKKEKESLEKEISKKNKDINNINKQIQEYIHMKYLVKAGTTADAQYAKLIEEARVEKKNLRSERKKLNKDVENHETYISDLDNLNNIIASKQAGMETMVTSNFSKILGNLGKDIQATDITGTKDLADGIYSELVSGINMNEAHLEITYGEFLQDYIVFKRTLDNLESIRKIQESNTDENIVSTISETEKLVKSFPKEEEVNEWRTNWNNALSSLKQDYNKLNLLFTSTTSVTSDAVTPNAIASDNATSNDVTNIIPHISYLQRSLLTEINGIESARYYFVSKHCLLARLSFALAAFLDIIPVLLMIIREGIRRKNGKLIL